MTAQEALAGLTATDPEVQTVTLRTIFQLPTMPELYDITVLNLDSADARVVFFSLDMLIKKYTWQLQHDATELIPKLLTLLHFDNAPVTDRAMWALTVAGDQSIPAIIHGIATAAEEQQQVMLLWALGSNGHARRHAATVLATFRTALHAPSHRVQVVALHCLIGFMRPLSPEGLGFISYDFTPLVPEVQQVGQTLLEQARLENNDSEIESLQHSLSFLPR